MHASFSVFKRPHDGGQRYWYAKFWSEEGHRYQKTRTLDIPVAGRYGGRDLAVKADEALVAQVERSSDPFLLDFVSAFWTDDPLTSARGLW